MDRKLIVFVLIGLAIMFLLGMLLFGRLDNGNDTSTGQSTLEPSGTGIGLQEVTVGELNIAIDPDSRQLRLESESQPPYAIGVTAIINTPVPISTPSEILLTPQPGQQIVEVTREVIVEVTRFVDVTRIINVTATPSSPAGFVIPQVTPTAVPNPQPDTSGGVSTTNYIVQPGDTLSTIAERFGINFDLMMQYNGYRDLIYPGETILLPLVGGTIGGNQSTPVPSGVACAGDDIQHTVIPGNTVYSLALSYGTTIEAIRQNNGLSFNYLIYPDQILCIPR